MLAWVVLRRHLPYVLGVILILGMGYWIYRSGYNSGADDITRKYEEKIQEERERQLEANKAAQEKAEKAEDELRRILSERNDTIRILMQEAFNDPGSDTVCLGPDSLRRINRIR